MKENHYQISQTCSLSAEEMLRIIYESGFLGNDSLHDSARDISEAIGLSMEQCMVLAWLKFHSDAEYTIETAEEAFGFSDGHLDNLLDSLAGKGLVTKVTGPYDVDTYDMDISLFENSLGRHLGSEKDNTMTDEEFIDKLVHSDHTTISSLIQMLDSTPDTCPSGTFCNGYRTLCSKALSSEEKYALLTMARWFAVHGMEPLCLKDDEESTDNSRRKQYDRLVNKGIVCILPESSNQDERSDGTKDRYILSPDACRLLFKGQKNLIDYTALSHQADLTRCNDIREKTLCFNEAEKSSLDTISDVVSQDKFEAVISRLSSRNRRKGITCLIHGAPGTGKTEFARQLARKSGRDIFIADASKILGSLWGESEKNCRELFRSYRYLYAVSDNAPIFVFNEADGILGKRLSASRSIDRAENTLQTILLQELEQFEGIFIAITNLAGELDDAFERRFLFKVEFHKPDVTVREKIWKTHIPELSDSDAKTLAKAYEFSGGQIENIAMKRDISESLTGKALSIQQTLKICEEEPLGSKKPDRLSIKGFSSYKY